MSDQGELPKIDHLETQTADPQISISNEQIATGVGLFNTWYQEQLALQADQIKNHPGAATPLHLQADGALMMLDNLGLSFIHGMANLNEEGLKRYFPKIPQTPIVNSAQALAARSVLVELLEKQRDFIGEPVDPNAPPIELLTHDQWLSDPRTLEQYVDGAQTMLATLGLQSIINEAQGKLSMK